MDATVVVVNWNTRALLLDCLASVVRDGGPVSLDVVVVDNGSSDGSAAAVRERFPGVRLLENDRNLGFARAVNQGIRSSRARHVVLLNSDAVVTEAALARLVRFLDEHADVGVAGAQLLDRDGARQHSFDNFPSLATELLNKSLLRRLWPARFPSKRRAFAAPADVESVIGACIAVRRAALERVGLLDEEYFVFLEETDWCLRMGRMGFRVVHVPEARVVHLQGASKRAAPGRARVEYLRSLYSFFRKQRPGWQGWVVRGWRALRTSLGAAGALAGWALTGFRRASWRERAREKAWVLLWHLLLCPEWMGLRPRKLPTSEHAAAGPLPPTCRGFARRDGWNWTRGAEAAEGEATRAAGEALAAAWAACENGGGGGGGGGGASPSTAGVGVERLKQVRIKSLFRVEVAGARFWVKVYPLRTVAQRVRALLLGTRARREFELERRIRGRGIPTATSVGWCEWGAWGLPLASAVASSEVRDVEPMDRYLRSPATSMAAGAARTRRRVLDGYGRFGRRVHDAGVLQDDFDPNNVLLAIAGSGEPSLVLVDFERVRLLDRVADGRRVWNLAKLNRFEGVGRTDRLRYLRGYCAADGPGALKRWARAILDRMRDVRERDRRRAGRNCMTESRNFGRANWSGVSCAFRRALPGGRMGLSPEAAESLLARAAGDAAPGVAELDWPLGDRLVRVRLSRFATCLEATQSWRRANGALQAREPVPTPLAVFWSWRGEAWGRGLFVEVLEAPPGRKAEPRP